MTPTARMLAKYDELRDFGNSEHSALQSAAAHGCSVGPWKTVSGAKAVLRTALAGRKAGGHSMTAALL